jgi:hypothetical protein
MSRIDSYDSVNSIPSSELPLFISQPIDTTEDIVYTIRTVIFVTPIIVIDLYFAYNDDSCVNLQFTDTNINLRSYLIVSGFSGILGIVGAFICLYYKSLIIRPKLIPILETIYILFNLMWNIIGALIFWGTMDNSICKNGIHNYLTSFIILKSIWFSYSLTKKLLI